MSETTETNGLEPAYEALDDAHGFWHEAQRSYQRPRAFRRNVDALIQTARNVTFRIQALKGELHDFDAWYPAWQDWMKADTLMKWLHDARTQVTKRRGLEARSIARVSLVYSYAEPATKTVELNPDLEIRELLQRATQGLPDTVLANSIAEVERRWEADGLPGEELLEALAEAIRVLTVVVTEAHKLHAGEATGRPEDVVGTTDLPGCMEWNSELRRVRVDPMTGELRILETRPIPVLSNEAMEARARQLGWTADDFGPIDSNDPFAVGELILRMAKRTLVVDKFHSGLLLLHDRDGHWLTRGHIPEDRVDKFVFWRHVAEEIHAGGMDGLVFVGEFWAAPATDIRIGPYPDIASAPNRREELIVLAADSTGRTRGWMTPFRRRLGRIVLGETAVIQDFTPAFLWPVLRVWRVDPQADAYAATFSRPQAGERLSRSTRLYDRALVGLSPPPALLLDEEANERALRMRSVLEHADAVYVADPVNAELMRLARQRERLDENELDIRPLAEDFFIEVQLDKVFRGKPIAWGTAFEARSDEQLLDDEATRRFDHAPDVWERIVELAEVFRWVLTAELIVEHVESPPVGPIASTLFGVRTDGSWVRLGSGLTPPTGEDTGVERMSAIGRDAMLFTSILTISLLNTGHASVEERHPRRTASRDHKRESGRGLSAYRLVSPLQPLRGRPLR